MNEMTLREAIEELKRITEILDELAAQAKYRDEDGDAGEHDS